MGEKRKTTKKKTKNKTNTENKKQNEIFNFNEEIVIGINSAKPSEKQNKEKKPKTKKKQKKKSTPKKNEGSKLFHTLIKWTILLLALIGASIYFLMSPLFNIQVIEVQGNEKVSQEEIMSLAHVQKGENIYKFSKRTTTQKIKENAYIDTVQIKRLLPNGVLIQVEEREPTYLLELGSAYIYIDNQGYVLELSEEKLELPTLIGYETKVEQLTPGKRLLVNDLKKLEKVIELTSAAKNNEVLDKILKIDITNIENFKLILEGNKVAYVGSFNNLNVKMLYLREILNREEGKAGEVFLEGEGGKTSVFFREQI